LISGSLSFSSYKNILNNFEKAKTITFDFTQSYISEDKTESITEKGRAYYKTGFWRWDYLGIDKRAYFILGDEIYEKSEDGIEKLNLTKEQFNKSIINILKKPNEFINSHKKENKGDLIIIFANQGENFSKVKIYFKKRGIDRIIIISQNSDILKLDFSRIKFNDKIDDSIFQIKK
jgi:outer membrane lipoprotein-sorting protein